MKKLFSHKKQGDLLLLALLFYLPSFGQSFFVKGRVTNNENQALSGVSIVIEETERQSITNEAGEFSIADLPGGTYHFRLAYLGYTPEVFKVKLEENTVLKEPWRLTASASVLEEVVVSSQQDRDKTIATLPTELVSGSYIRKNLSGSLMQSLEKLPGIKSIGIGSSNSKPLIRGLGFNEVMVVENGMKHEGQQWGDDHGLEIDQFNAGKVEVTKGPASFIYGSDALGGVIDIHAFSKPLPHTSGGSVDLVGKSNNRNAGGSLYLYTRGEKWFIDGRLTYMDYADYRVPADTVYTYSYAVPLHDHFVRNTAGEELDKFIRTGYAGGKWNSTFYISHNTNKSGFFANAHGLEPRNVDESLHDASSRDVQLPYQQVTHFKVINRSEWDLADHRLYLDIGFQNNNRQEFSSYVSHGYMPPIYPKGMPYPKNLERKFDKNVWSLNLKDEWTFQNHKMYFGWNGERQNNRIGGWNFLIPAFKSFHWGAFVYDTYTLSDAWTFLGALRYDRGRMEVEEYRDWFKSRTGDEEDEAYLQRAPSFSKNLGSLSWSLGVQYHPDAFRLSVNIGKSFRMPLAKELASNGVNYHYFRYEKGNTALHPEASYQIDAELDWKDKEKQFKLTPFLNYFSNYIYLNPTSGYDTYYGAGNQIFEYEEARVLRTGFELQAGYQFAKDWHFELSGEYLYTRQLSGTKKGYTLPFSTPASALFSLSYEPVLGDRFLIEPYFTLENRLTAAQNQIVPPEKKTPGSDIWNFSLGSQIHIRSQKLEVNLSIRNLLNTKYLNHTSFYRIIELPEPGRNIILSVKLPFDLKR